MCLVELDARVERGDDLLHDVGLRQPELRRLGPIDVDQILRIIEPLDDPGVHHAVDLGDLAPHHRGDPVRDLLVLGGHPDADRRGLALVHRRADHAAGVEGEFQVAELGLAGDTLAQLGHVFLGRFLPLGRELDLDDGIHRAGVGRVRRRPVGRDAQLREHQLQVFLVDDLADIIFHRRDPLLRLLDSQARRRPHVHLERARIDLGEELLAQHRPEKDDGERQQAIGDDKGCDPVPQDEVEPLDVVLDAGIDHPLPAVEGSRDDVAPGLMAIAIDLECLGLRGAFRRLPHPSRGHDRPLRSRGSRAA